MRCIRDRAAASTTPRGCPPPKASATSATSTPAPPSAPVAPRPSPAGTRGTFDASVSTTARELDRRFHGDWRCEVAEQIEEGGEVIVLCKLRIRSKNIIRSQFGSARISGAAGASGAQVKGAADGVSFALDTEGSQHPGASESAREAAFQGAMEQALAHCLETL